MQSIEVSNNNNKRAIDNDDVNELDECKRPALGPSQSTEDPPHLELTISDKMEVQEYNPYGGLWTGLETIYPTYKKDAQRIGEGCCFIRVGIDAVNKDSKKKTYCVLADRSQSMNLGNRYENLCNTLKVMFSSIKETGDEENIDIVVIAFNNSATVIYGPGKIPDDAKMSEIKCLLLPNGGTDIARALESFYDVSESLLREGRPVIGVLFTDGDDSSLSAMVRAFKQQRMMMRETDTVLSKLCISGRSAHYVAICRDANGKLLCDLAELSNTTFSTVEGGVATVGLIGSFLGLCKEKMSETVTISIHNGDVLVIDKKHINPRFGNDGYTVNIPMKLESTPGEIKVEICVYKIGDNHKTAEPAYTLSKTFVWRSVEENCEELASMDCVAEEVNRIKAICDKDVASALTMDHLGNAGIANDAAMTMIAELLELKLDESTVACVTSAIENLEAQGAEIAESINRGYVDVESRDRALSRSLTVDNGMSLTDPSYESRAQSAGRTLSYQLAPIQLPQ